MTPEQEKLFLVRAGQCLDELDSFLKNVAKTQAIPQALRDAVEAFRECVKGAK